MLLLFAGAFDRPHASHAALQFALVGKIGFVISAFDPASAAAALGSGAKSLTTMERGCLASTSWPQGSRSPCRSMIPISASRKRSTSPPSSIHILGRSLSLKNIFRKLDGLASTTPNGRIADYLHRRNSSESRTSVRTAAQRWLFSASRPPFHKWYRTPPAFGDRA